MIVLVVVLVLQPMVGKLMSMEPPKSAMDEILQAELLAPATENPALAAPGATGTFPRATAETGQLSIDDDDDDMVNITGIEGKVKASTVKKVEEIVDSYPEETVSVIRSWMSQES